MSSLVTGDVVILELRNIGSYTKLNSTMQKIGHSKYTSLSTTPIFMHTYKSLYLSMDSTF